MCRDRQQVGTYPAVAYERTLHHKGDPYSKFAFLNWANPVRTFRHFGGLGAGQYEYNRDIALVIGQSDNILNIFSRIDGCQTPPKPRN